MTLSVFCILLFAALLHASWNAIVKAGNDKLYAAIGVSGSAAVMALILLPFSPQPAHASIPFLAASTALQVVYTVLVAKTYQVKRGELFKIDLQLIQDNQKRHNGELFKIKSAVV